MLTNIRSFTELRQLILINLIVSVGIPLVLFLAKVLTGSESILFGSMLGILTTSLETLWYAKKIREDYHNEHIKLSIKTEFDRKLASIQQSFGNILERSYGESDLFQQHFEREVADLEEHISKGDIEQELQADYAHFNNANIALKCFNSEPTDFFWGVHFLRDNRMFFDIFQKSYFYSAHALVLEKKIQGVKRLLVFSSDDELLAVDSLKIIRFHASTPGYEYKVIRADAYAELLNDNKLHGSPDFAIYGRWYLFRRQLGRPEETLVSWSKNEKFIQRYSDFFDNTWNSKFAFFVDSDTAKEPITIDDLFK